MQKKVKVLICVSLVCVLGILCGSVAVARSSTTVRMKNWGKVLKANSIKEYGEDEVYAKGTRINLKKKDIEQTKTFYVLTGMDEREATEKAVDYVAEREVLYQVAIDNGYEVTEQQVWEYIDELKKMIESADNKEEALAVMREFDSEEDYWNYQFTVYKKSLPIQNYVRDVEQMYMQTNVYSEGNLEDTWQEYFAQMKEQLVEQENFQVIK